MVAFYVFGRNGSFGGISAIPGGGVIELSADDEKPSRQLGTVGAIITDKKSFLPPSDDELGDVHS